MPSSTLIPFLVGLGSLINPFKQKRGTLFHPRLLGNLEEPRVFGSEVVRAATDKAVPVVRVVWFLVEVGA